MVIIRGIEAHLVLKPSKSSNEQKNSAKITRVTLVSGPKFNGSGNESDSLLKSNSFGAPWEISIVPDDG